MTFAAGRSYDTRNGGKVTVEEIVPKEPRLRCSDGLWRHADGRCFDICGSDWDLKAAADDAASA